MGMHHNLEPHSSDSPMIWERVLLHYYKQEIWLNLTTSRGKVDATNH